MDTAAKTDRHAHGLFTGVDFQINAGIILFIHWIKNATSIRLEGEDDIEIRFKDGRGVYAQAKAATHPDTFGDTNRLRAAFETISENVIREDCAYAVYVTNDQKPFGKRIPSSQFLVPCTYFSYNELPEAVRKKIDQLLNRYGVEAKFAPSVAFSVFQFMGADDDTRYSVVLQEIRKLLQQIETDGYDFFNERTVRGTWGSMLLDSAQDPSDAAHVSKADFMWVLVAGLCGRPEVNRWEEQYDKDEIALLRTRYGQVIKSASNRFATVTKVVADFESHCLSSVGKSVKQQRDEFINLRASAYIDDLGLSGCPESDAIVVCGEVLRKILVRQEQIQAVKRVACLED